MGKAMAACQPCFSCSAPSRPAVVMHKFRCPRRVIRAQCKDDKGGSMNIVDANMSILRERMEEVRIQERLQRCCRGGAGWNNSSSYDSNLRSRERLHESVTIAGLMAWSFGLTFLCGTLSMGLLSIMVRLIH